MADVCPLSRGVSDSVQRRVPRVLFRFIGGEEREVLPPHVARELRDVLLVADAEIHGMPTEAEVRMILRVVFLVQRLREAVSTFEELERTARRVLGGGHPLMTGIEKSLRNAQAALRAGKGGFPGNT